MKLALCFLTWKSTGYVSLFVIPCYVWQHWQNNFTRWLMIRILSISKTESKCTKTHKLEKWGTICNSPFHSGPLLQKRQWTAVVKCSLFAEISLHSVAQCRLARSVPNLSKLKYCGVFFLLLLFCWVVFFFPSRNTCNPCKFFLVERMYLEENT